jgi:hypothetical protein
VKLDEVDHLRAAPVLVHEQVNQVSGEEPIQAQSAPERVNDAVVEDGKFPPWNHADSRPVGVNPKTRTEPETRFRQRDSWKASVFSLTKRS